jgi:hypothetical protein
LIRSAFLANGLPSLGWIMAHSLPNPSRRRVLLSKRGQRPADREAVEVVTAVSRRWSSEALDSPRADNPALGGAFRKLSR